MGGRIWNIELYSTGSLLQGFLWGLSMFSLRQVLAVGPNSRLAYYLPL